ncbi:MAG: LPD38 domain-containing protein [Bacteroidales bacterium]|nr:LPD38 domain-containing protein [Bacteroidales bacterium]
MSKMLGISPKSIGQGGWLNVGSLRSNASSSAEHSLLYNRFDQSVSKPTLKYKYSKLKGLAHEWWHALDHALSYFETGKGRITASEISSRSFTGRRETWDAVHQVIEAIKDSGHVSRIYSLKFPPRYTSYYLEPSEMAARAFEEYIKAKFASAGIVIENAVDTDFVAQPTAEEMAVITPAFDNLFKVLQEKEGKKPGTSILFQIGEDTNERLEGISEKATRLADEAVALMINEGGIETVSVSNKEAEQMHEASGANVDFMIAPDKPIFVSNAAMAVAAIKMEKATPEQWLKMIEKAGGLKAGEDKWMELSEWLKASDKKTLTKQDVLDYIHENTIQIEEVNYIPEINFTAEEQKHVAAMNKEFAALRQSAREAGESYADAGEIAYQQMADKYGDDFTLGFGVDMGELYVSNIEAAASITGIELRQEREINSTRLDYTTGGLDNKKEIAIVVPTVESWNKYDEVHFGDAGDGRAVAWIRFGETKKLLGTTEVEGKKKFNWAKVLVIDEIQSKRHQEGRDRGYSIRGEEYQKRLDSLETEAGDRLKRRTELLRTLTEKYGEDFRSYLKLENTAYVPNESVMSPEEVQEWDATSQEEINDAIDVLKKQKRAGVPDAPFDKNWHELAMKRMLRYAAENGYDVVAWTKGDQQADRYSLTKSFSSIEREDRPDGDGGRRFSLYGGNVETIYVDENGVVTSSSISNELEDKPLSDVVGKELAVKMMSLENYDTIDGEDLRIGGEGMKGFYDKILPAFMNKYGKKWGVKVEDIHLSLEGGLDMHSVPVTEEMKASVIEGQPMFMKRPNGKVYGWTDGKKIYLTKDGFNPNTRVHEYTHLWAKAMMQKNPKGWQSIKDLLRGTPIWNEVINDANYSSIHHDEDMVASEALSRISGTKNAAKLERMAQQMIDEAKGTMRKLEAQGLIQRIKDALNEFWSWVGTNLFGIEKFDSVEQVTDRVLWDLMNKTDLGELSEGQVETQIVTDPKVVEELEASPKRAGYRNVVQNEDGTFSSPMAYWLQSTKGGAKTRVETAKFELGKWEEAEEHPELVDEKGHVTLVKPNKSTVEVAYDPYIHNRLDPVNLQFKDAWKREELVYVETEVPETDLESGYHADGALLPVGVHSWSNGDLMLSKYDKPVRIMPWEDVADAWVERLNGEGVHFDVVPPALRTLLVERSVEILPPHKGMGKDCNDAYNEWKKENPQSVPQDSSTSPSPKVESNQMAERTQTKDAAKIQKSIESLRELASLSKNAKVVNASTIVNHLADALHIIVKRNETSDTSKRNKYVLPNGETLSVRLSKHNTSASTYIEFNFNQKYNLAVTIKSIRKPNTFVADEGVRLDEYVYFIEDIKKYNGSVLSEIASSLADFLEFGVYVDTTGIAKINTSPKGVAPRTLENYNQDSEIEITKKNFILDPDSISQETAKQTYDRVVNDGWQEFQRQFQDAYQPVRIAIDAIQQETGNLPIEDYENYLLMQNQSSSRSRVETDNFRRKYYDPIYNQIEKIVNKILESRGYDIHDKAKRAEAYAEIKRYLIAKHGLERNMYYQSTKTRKLNPSEKKIAQKETQNVYNAEVSIINSDTSLTDTERELKLREAQDAFTAALTEIETREVPDLRDYSGLTSLFGMDPKEFEKAEEEAQRVVDEFESEVGTITDELWNKINKATGYTLRHSYESGLLSRSQYEQVKSMFEFYIPLRGFDETTAEDVYSYARFEGNRFNAVDQTAKGRTSVADDPIATIMNMAESEISQGNKNRAKQALYYYLLNRSKGGQNQNSLMQLEDVWYIETVDESGNTISQIAAPDHENGETYEEFEDRMTALAAEGKAAKSKKGKVDIGMRFQKQKHLNAHYVYLKVNGIEKAIYINGDPKAADAINGTHTQKNQFGESTMRSINRVLSSTFTNYSLEFTARNYFRDMFYSHINIDVREPDPAYRKKFRQNWRHNNIGTMIKMLKSYRAGEFDGRPLTEDEAAFVEFMNNGGQTGYTLINSVENHKKDLQNAIERMQNGLEKGGIKDSTAFKFTLGAIELLNEASELVTRFAAFKTSRDMGRGVVRSISDAKEITVNFNTKGAQDGNGWMGAIARYLGWSKFFFNASVQGVQNIAAMARANKLKFGSVVGSVFATGLLMPAITAAISSIFGGDDDDNEYWNIPEYERQNNFCIVIGNGKYIKIPLPIGFREIYALGDMTASMMWDKKFTRDTMQVGMDMANKIASVILPINPLESSANGLSIWHSIGYTLAPSSAQFLIQNMSNVDWKGAPLQKEYTYNENDPQWMKAFASNPTWMRSLSKWFNENTRFGDYEGWDWSPEKLDNTLSNMFGGIYSLIKKTGRSVSMIWNEENRNLSNIPLSGVVLGSGIENDDRFVTDAYFDMNDYYNANVNFIKRRAEKFGYNLEDVFVKRKGIHHPKMLEIYNNPTFEWMQMWYNGNEELKELKNKINKLEAQLESKESPSEQQLYSLAKLKAKFTEERRDFVDDMLELD